MTWYAMLALAAAFGLAGWIFWKLNSPKHKVVSCIGCGECVRAGRCVLGRGGPAPKKEPEKGKDPS